MMPTIPRRSLKARLQCTDRNLGQKSPYALSSISGGMVNAVAVTHGGDKERAWTRSAQEGKYTVSMLQKRPDYQ